MSYMPMLRGYRNRISRPLYEVYYLRPLRVLQGVDFDHPGLDDIREVEHVELLTSGVFRLTVSFVEGIISADGIDSELARELEVYVRGLRSFARFTKRIRKRLGLRQVDIVGACRYAKMSQSTYSRIERGMEWPMLLDIVEIHQAMWPGIGMDIHSYIQFAGYGRHRKSSVEQ